MAGATGAGAFVVEDFAEYLCGTWKRNLEWRHFGGSFEHVRSSQSVVVIEDRAQVAKATDASGSRVRNLRWSFGNSLKGLRFGYSMKFIPDSTGSFLQWQYGGNSCHGTFRPKGNVAILNFYLDSSTVTITYRAMDNDTMAVSIVEVNESHTSTIQFGNMFRIRPELYGVADTRAARAPAAGASSSDAAADAALPESTGTESRSATGGAGSGGGSGGAASLSSLKFWT